MPIEVALWRFGPTLTRIAYSALDAESRLEKVLCEDVSLVDPNLLLIGRQVPTAFGKFIDLLALDPDGNLVVVELKRDRTPREIVAQLLDYGSWVRNLNDDDIAGIFANYLAKYYPQHTDTTVEQAFSERFKVAEVPETLNESHKLVMVASELDDSTERIIKYLADEYGVAINAVFFRFFRDEDRDYLSRAWLIDPELVEAKVEEKREKLPWNGEYYVSFGHGDDGTSRHWDDARKYGFVSAGGGEWYVRTLKLLEPGGRVWINIPARGYVGVGTVVEGPTPANEFMVRDGNGKDVPITTVKLQGNLTQPPGQTNGVPEHLVRINWTNTVPVEEAVREKGFFGNQNSAAKPRTSKWVHTVERLKTLFKIKD